MAGKTFAGIFTSKAQEDVIVPSASGRRRRRRGGSFTVQESHWWNRKDRDADLTQSWQRGGGRAAVDGESRCNLADLHWSLAWERQVLLEGGVAVRWSRAEILHRRYLFSFLSLCLCFFFFFFDKSFVCVFDKKETPCGLFLIISFYFNKN